MEPYIVKGHKETRIGRFTVVQDDIEIKGKSYPYSYTALMDSVCILPICDDKIVIINEYRHSLKKWIWEFPAGAIDEGETPISAAERELLEEAGYKAEKLIEIGVYPVSPGTSSLMAHFFVAHCTKADKRMPEETEIISTREISGSELENMIRNHEFVFLAGIVMWDMYKRGLHSEQKQ